MDENKKTNNKVAEEPFESLYGMVDNISYSFQKWAIYGMMIVALLGVVGFSIYGMYQFVDEKLYDLTPVTESGWAMLTTDKPFSHERFYNFSGEDNDVLVELQNNSEYNIELIIMTLDDYEQFANDEVYDYQSYTVNANSKFSETIEFDRGEWVFIVDNSNLGDLSFYNELIATRYNIDITYREPRFFDK